MSEDYLGDDLRTFVRWDRGQGKAGRALDVVSAILARAVESDTGQHARAQGILAAIRIVNGLKQSPSWRSLRLIEGRDGSSFVAEAIEALNRTAAERARSSYGTYRWLWYLRRLPMTVWTGGLPSTAPYDRQLTEILATRGAAGRPPSQPVSDDGLFPVDAAVARRIGWIVGFSQIVSQMHRVYRVIGKGGRAIIGPKAPPSWRWDAALQRAASIYDERAHETYFAARLGSAVLREVHPRDWSPSTLLVLGRPTEEAIMEIPLGPDDSRLVPTVMRWVPSFIDTNELEALLRHGDLVDPSLWNDDIPTLLLLLSFALYLYAVSPPNRPNLHQTGYVIISRELFREFWDGVAGDMLNELRQRFGLFASQFPGTGEQFLESVFKYHGTPWPLHAGPLAFHVSDSQIGLDIANAGQRFLTSMQFPRIDGRVANVRALSFEESTQRSIDRMPWTASAEARALVEKRRLRLHGRDIGDIDAAAIGPTTAILISCKSLLYTPQYDAGDFSAVAGAAAKIDQALKEWDAFIEVLRSNPVGDNYDVRSLGELVGVVITPATHFIMPPMLDRMAVRSLRAYSSLSELITWLESTPPF